MRALNLIGQQFGALTVLSRIGQDENQAIRWMCACGCGNQVAVTTGHLRSGHSTSCGCLRDAARFKHGACNRTSKTPEYRTWAAMLNRCHYTPAGVYKKHGIEVCVEWRQSFQAFLDHVGPRPKGKSSIDRKDNTLGYVPGNVRWVSKCEQDRNRSTNRRITIGGVTKTLIDWIETCGVSAGTVRSRIYRQGWDPVRAITTPTKRRSV